MSFESFGLSAELLRAIADKGYNEPTPVQSQAIPIILEGSDLMAGSQTGTGKTAGFTLPLLQNLIKRGSEKRRSSTRALILTPTRELAAQVEQSIRTYAKYLPIKVSVVFGGVNIKPQIFKLRTGVDILVATPGRLLDLVNQRAVSLSHVETFVLDEADHMLDMGFIHDIRKIIALLPKERQNLMFSATYSDEIKKLADGLLHEPKSIQVAKRNATAENVSQVIHPVDTKRKRELLTHLITSQDWKQVLVFIRTKHTADRLAEQLMDAGITAVTIHGNKSQGARSQALAQFKQGKVRVLVATDIAARGLDINNLPHVINYDLPCVPEDYIHRIGRTGRAGNVGGATSLVSVDEHKLLYDIERLLKCKIPQVVIEAFKPDPKIRAVPVMNGRFGKKNGRPMQPRRSNGGNNSNPMQPRRSNGGNNSNNSNSRFPSPSRHRGSFKPSR